MVGRSDRVEPISSVCTFVDWGDVKCRARAGRARGSLRGGPRGPWRPSGSGNSTSVGCGSYSSLQKEEKERNSREEKNRLDRYKSTNQQKEETLSEDADGEEIRFTGRLTSETQTVPFRKIGSQYQRMQSYWTRTADVLAYGHADLQIWLKCLETSAIYWMIFR